MRTGRVKSFLGIGVLTVALACGIPHQAQADTIFSSLGPGDTWGGASILVGWAEGSTSRPAGQYDLGVLFVPGGTYYLGSFRFAARYYGGLADSVNSLTMYITPNAASWGPDVDHSLESFVFNDLSATAGLYAADSSARPLLLSGQEYWLLMSVAYGTSIAWEGSPVGPPAGLPYPFLMSNGIPGAGIIFPAFSVEGTPVSVPEPAPGLLLMTGLGVWALTVWRRGRTR